MDGGLGAAASSDTPNTNGWARWMDPWLSSTNPDTTPDGAAPDTDCLKKGMVEEMRDFRDRVNAAVAPLPPNQVPILQIVCLASTKIASDGKNELLICEMFTLMYESWYRSHAGHLYEYNNGAWVEASSISSSALQHGCQTLRAAESVLLQMDNEDIFPVHPDRNFLAVAGCATYILGINTIPVLLERLLDTTELKLTSRATWSAAAAYLVQEMHRFLTERSRRCVDLFHQWAESKVPDVKNGVSFQDTYLEFPGNGVVRKRKNPENNCYTYVPWPLRAVPDASSIERLHKFVTTTLAGTDALRLLLSVHCIALMDADQPDVLVVCVGPGQDGKTMLNVNLAENAFGSAFATAPCSLLQVDQEFKKQGHNFVSKKHIAFDESRRSNGLQEETTKNFISGGSMEMRKNHAPETFYARWPSTAKCWNMNVGDIPYIPTAMEKSWGRRLRCFRIRSHIVTNSADAAPARKEFLIDLSLKAWLKSPAAGLAWWKCFILPFVKEFSKDQMVDFIMRPPATIERDTQWLLRKMADVDVEDDELGEGCSGEATQNAERIVRETHASMTAKSNTKVTFSAAEICHLRVASNTGVRHAYGAFQDAASAKNSRSAILMEACPLFPYLILPVPGRKHKGVPTTMFQKRQLSPQRMEQSMVAAAGPLRPISVFGDWPLWGTYTLGSDAEGLASAEDWHREATTATNANQWGKPFAVLETVDAQSLAAYANLRNDRRQSQTDAYLDLVAKCGALHQLYRRKVIAGAEMGRMYGTNLCLQFVTRECRVAATPNCYELDLSNAHVAILSLLAKRMGEPRQFLELYSAHKRQWRQCVASYFDIDEEGAKKHLLCALYGSVVSRPMLGVLPFVAALLRECKNMKDVVARAHPGVAAHFRSEGRDDPSNTTLFYVIADMEHAALMRIIRSLPAVGLALVVPLFDGCVARPIREEPDIAQLQSQIAEEFGLALEIKRQPGNQKSQLPPVASGDGDGSSTAAPLPKKLRAASVTSQLEGLFSRSDNPFGSAGQCVPHAMWPLIAMTGGEAAASALVKKVGSRCGPFSYREMELAADVRFVNRRSPPTSASFRGKTGIYLLHEPREGGVGHCIGMRILADVASFYDIRLGGRLDVRLGAMSDSFLSKFSIVRIVPSSAALDSRSERVRAELMGGSSDEEYYIDRAPGALAREDFLAYINAEVVEYRKHCSGLECKICVSRRWPKSRQARALEHVRKHHRPGADSACSPSKKQLKVARALFDDDEIRELATMTFTECASSAVDRRYLMRSAEVVRGWISTSQHYEAVEGAWTNLD